VNSSEHGMSEKEISSIMKVRVSNQLNTLTGEGKIKKIRLDGRYRYYSNNAKLGNSSKSDRQDKEKIQPSNEHETTLAKTIESRDKWRERSNIYRKTIKLLSLKIRDLTNSRENWRQKAEDYKKQGQILQSELTTVKKTSSQK
jgi:DNA-binding transcriptional ArsR family regulator